MSCCIWLGFCLEVCQIQERDGWNGNARALDVMKAWVEGYVECSRFCKTFSRHLPFEVEELYQNWTSIGGTALKKNPKKTMKTSVALNYARNEARIAVLTFEHETMRRRLLMRMWRRALLHQTQLHNPGIPDKNRFCTLSFWDWQ